MMNSGIEVRNWNVLNNISIMLLYLIFCYPLVTYLDTHHVQFILVFEALSKACFCFFTKLIFSLSLELESFKDFRKYLEKKIFSLKILFSVAKATLQSQMSVRPSVRPSVCKTPQQLEIINLHHSTIHPSSFFIHPSFISQLLSFSACFLSMVKLSQH